MKNNNDQFQFIPPFCPFQNCIFHLEAPPGFCKKNGMIKTQKPPFVNQRFRCKSCRKQFSRNTFSIDFKKVKPDLSDRILDLSMNSMSNSQIARLLKIGESTVRNRLKTLAVQALIFEKQNQPDRISEDVAYDGFETFTHSQFSPCYINTAVGRRSHFIYHNTFSPLNRKGRMTPEQKEKQDELIRKHGLYPQDSVYQETCYVITEIEKKATTEVTFYSDEHKSYGRAHRTLNSKLHHEKISSLERRDASNNLFPINHLHMLYRHYLSSQKRETIAFQKHEAALMDKIELMKIWRNFMSPKFVKKSLFDKHAHEWSPAMYLGLSKRILNFNEVFGVRKLVSQVKLDERERKFVRREYEFSRHKIAS